MTRALLVTGFIYLTFSICTVTCSESFIELRGILQGYINSGNFREVLKRLYRIEEEFGTLVVDTYYPTLYLYKGVALHGLHMLQEAEKTFQESLIYFPDDTRSLINLGEMQTLLMKFNLSIIAYEEAYKRGEKMALTRLLAAKGWCDSWKDFEVICAEVERDANRCVSRANGTCYTESAFGLEYTAVSGETMKYFHMYSPYSWQSQHIIHPQARATLSLPTLPSPSAAPPARLRVGVISSDFGVHPVSSLIRGVLQFIDKSKIELFCFSVTTDVGWWGVNVSQSVEHFHVLAGINTQDGATMIASKKIDILIDLNGHTKNSGLTYLSHRPAPIQMSFLGLPTTTGTRFIDYYIGDYIALPPEISTHFTEKLLLMNPCYISNDYAQLQGDVVKYHSSINRAPRNILETDQSILHATLLFGTISNSQKMDPNIFHVWLNILRRVSGAMMLFTSHAGLDSAIINLRHYCSIHGIDGSRLVMSTLAPWLDHLYQKTAIDLLLDTSVKNGHTTGLDGIWAGVPTVTFGFGKTMPQRAGDSIAAGLGSRIGVTYSLKEYEEFVDRFADNGNLQFDLSSDESVRNHLRRLLEKGEGRNDSYSDPIYRPSFHSMRAKKEREREETTAEDRRRELDGIDRLRIWRDHVQRLRTSSPLFDTRNWTVEFTQLLQSSWDMTMLSVRRRRYNANPLVNPREETATATATPVPPSEASSDHFYGGVSIKLKKKKAATTATVNTATQPSSTGGGSLPAANEREPCEGEGGGGEGKYWSLLDGNGRQDSSDRSKVASDYQLYHIFSVTRTKGQMYRQYPLEQAYDSNSIIFKGPKGVNTERRAMKRFLQSQRTVPDYPIFAGIDDSLKATKLVNATEEWEALKASISTARKGETAVSQQPPQEEEEGIHISDPIAVPVTVPVTVPATVTEMGESSAVSMAAAQREPLSLSKIPSSLFQSTKLIFLNIGGIHKLDGWLNVNVNTQPIPGLQFHTDYIRPMDSLGFPDNSVAAIYSCHNLEHNAVGDRSLERVLKEWHRALRPGGLLLLSVPDLRALARLYLDKSLDIQERWMVTMMIYGSQSSYFDYHLTGFDERRLAAWLLQFGYCHIERLASFNLFQDASEMTYKDYRISLNLAAKKCIYEGEDEEEAIEIHHNGSPIDRDTVY